MRRVILGLLISVLAGCALASRAYGSDIVPLAPDHVALTTQKYPSLCWVQERPIKAEDIIVILKDPSGIKATMDIKLPSSILADKGNTCRCVHLRDYGVQLEPNIQYQWLISFTQISESPLQKVLAGGVIERCDDECMFLEGQSECDQQTVLRSAHGGAWYDSISCLCGLIDADPQNQKLRRLLDRLLEEISTIHGES